MQTAPLDPCGTSAYTERARFELASLSENSFRDYRHNPLAHLSINSYMKLKIIEELNISPELFPDEKIYQSNYEQFGEHRKKCKWCGKLIKDGEPIVVSKSTKEGNYAVKGIMRFSTSQLYHLDCWMKRIHYVKTGKFL